MNAPLTATPPSRAAMIAAFIILYLVWGSTYLGIAIAIETLPPFLMAGIRFLAAGGLLFAALRLRGLPAPGAAQWRASAIVGVLLFVGGNGLVCWAEHWVPSGITALLIASTPLWMTLLPWLVRRAPAPPPLVWLGIALGLVGIALLVRPSASAAHGGDGAVFGAAAILAASLCWSIGSLWSKALPMPSSPWMSSAAQMLCGGAALTILGLALGEGGRLDLAAGSLRSWLALAYLVLIGAIVGFGAFVFLLKWSTPTRTATYAYVNPMVAVALGWLFRSEAITGTTALAAAFILVAVGVILAVRSRAAAPPRN